MRKFYNTPFSLYRLWTWKNRGTITETRTLVYENKKCSIWSTSKTYNQTSQAIQTNLNSYEINVSSEYSDILIGDIFIINWQWYKVLNIIPHEKANWIIDNYQIFVNITENADWIPN